jgi:predicted nucleic acid-binding protein
MIVVDTDVIASFWIKTTRTDVAVSVRRRDPDWFAPVLWRSEFRSVLRKYMVAGHMSYDDAVQIAQLAVRSFRGKEFMVDSDAVLRLVEKTGHSSYDCEYVALAQALDLNLVTGDRRVADLFGEVAVLMERFTL